MTKKEIEKKLHEKEKALTRMRDMLELQRTQSMETFELEGTSSKV